MLLVKDLIQILSSSVLKTQPAITCSKLTIKLLEHGVKYVQSEQ